MYKLNEKQFYPDPKYLTLTSVKANPEIQSLSQNPHASNPGGGFPPPQSHTAGENHIRGVRENGGV